MPPSRYVSATHCAYVLYLGLTRSSAWILLLMRSIGKVVSHSTKPEQPLHREKEDEEDEIIAVVESMCACVICQLLFFVFEESIREKAYAHVCEYSVASVVLSHHRLCVCVCVCAHTQGGVIQHTARSTCASMTRHTRSHTDIYIYKYIRTRRLPCPQSSFFPAPSRADLG